MYGAIIGRGYQGATIRRIAMVAQLTPGLVHYYFKSKRQVLDALLELLETEHARDLHIDLLQAADPAEKVALFIDHHLESCRETANPQAVACWAVVSGEALRQPDFAQDVENAFARITSKLAVILREGIEAGCFHCPTPQAAAVALVAAIHGYLCVASSTLELVPHVSAAACVKMMAASLLRATSPCLRDAVIPKPLGSQRDPGRAGEVLAPHPDAAMPPISSNDSRDSLTDIAAIAARSEPLTESFASTTSEAPPHPESAVKATSSMSFAGDAGTCRPSRVDCSEPESEHSKPDFRASRGS